MFLRFNKFFCPFWNWLQIDIEKILTEHDTNNYSPVHSCGDKILIYENGKINTIANNFNADFFQHVTEMKKMEDTQYEMMKKYDELKNIIGGS